MIVNRYPNTIRMGHKDYLKNMIGLGEFINSEPISFAPKTFNLPSEYDRLMKHMDDTKETMIVKGTAGCMSDSVHIVKELGQIPPQLV